MSAYEEEVQSEPLLPQATIVESEGTDLENESKAPVAWENCNQPRLSRIYSCLGVKVRRSYVRMLSCPTDELQRFRNSLFWLGLDQSSTVRLTWSWILFCLFTYIIPVLSMLCVRCIDCDGDHNQYQELVNYAAAAVSTISFLCLSHILRKFGLRKVLLLDQIAGEPLEIRAFYERELHNCFRLLALIILPCFLPEIAHKLWWITHASIEVPFALEDNLFAIIICAGMIIAWLYQSVVFLFVCVLFRLMCSLQILHLEEYTKLLKETSDVAIILREHMRIRDQLLVISHRFRIFMVASLCTITFSQLTILFVLMDAAETMNLFRACNLVVCSVVQLTGIVTCLHGAAKITHRAQRIMSIVSQWHALATCIPQALTASSVDLPVGPAHPLLYNESTGDLQSLVNVNSSAVEPCNHDSEAFHKRQALVAYLQHANAGISLYGFVLDRGFIYGIFGIEFSLALFILGKTSLV